MSITADEERRFYDSHYGQFLNLPDDQLAVNREVMIRTLNDPSQHLFERRSLYLAVLDTLLAKPLDGRRVLDYGCGPADWGVWMATEGAEVTLLDLSGAAVKLGLRRAEASGVRDRVRGMVRDASDLSCFLDGEFDLIFANASLHHTLKYEGSLPELIRVLNPGGMVVLAETFGNNPLLNSARAIRAKLSGEAEEQGEEIVIGDAEITRLRGSFRSVEVRPFSFLAMAKRLFRGRFESRLVRAGIRSLEIADAALLAMLPFLRRYCGEVIISARK